MDLDQINLLTNEQKQTYIELERVFNSPGWKHVQKWAQALLDDATQRQLNATTWEQNRLMAGGRAAFQSVVNLQEQTEAEFAQMALLNKQALRNRDEDEYE